MRAGAEQLLQNHAHVTCPKCLIKHLLLQFYFPIPAPLKANEFPLSAQRHFRGLWQSNERQGQYCKRDVLEAFFPMQLHSPIYSHHQNDAVLDSGHGEASGPRTGQICVKIRRAGCVSMGRRLGALRENFRVLVK